MRSFLTEGANRGLCWVPISSCTGNKDGCPAQLGNCTNIPRVEPSQIGIHPENAMRRRLTRHKCGGLGRLRHFQYAKFHHLLAR